MEMQLHIIQYAFLLYFYFLFIEYYGKPVQLFLAYNLVYNHDGIVQIATFDEVIVKQVLQLMQEAECATRAYLVPELCNRFQRSVLCAQYRRIKVD